MEKASQALNEETSYDGMKRVSRALKEEASRSSVKKTSDRDLGEMTKSQLIDIIKWQSRVMSSSPMEKNKHKRKVLKASTLSTIEEVPKPVPAPRAIAKEVRSALKGATASFEVSLRGQDPLRQLTDTREGLEVFLKNQLRATKGFKFVETLEVTFVKAQGVEKTAYFHSKAKVLTNKGEIEGSLRESQQRILALIGSWISEGSGWTIESIVSHLIHVVAYRPMKGSSYIILPAELKHSSKGLINIKNKGHECFRWCHVRHLNPQDRHPENVKKTGRKLVDGLDYSCVDFPVSVKHYNRVEKQNRIRINVFGYENKQPFPNYVSKERFDDCMNLLLISKVENKHYVLIMDFSKFMFKQTNHEHKKNFCMHCCSHFNSEGALVNHELNCIVINGEQSIKMPEKGSSIKFENYHRQLRVPFVIYEDFEALTEKVEKCQQDGNKSSTEAYQKHVDCGYAYKVVCCYDYKYSKPLQVYRGENAAHEFGWKDDWRRTVVS